ncbi:MAG TPA: M64 family metallopeptidase [Candidatus Dojkabacteria bacterium]|nr:M64 family metallopeptidase [Candidatus Dojkabacteria bacterium]
MQRQNVLRAFSYIVPLIVGLILVVGSSFKLIQPETTDNTKVEYLEVFSDFKYPEAYAHEIEIRVPGVKVKTITSTLAIEYTCEQAAPYNSDRICLRLYEKNEARQGSLFTAELEVPINKGTVTATSDSYARYYSDASFAQALPQEVRMVNKYNELSLSMGKSAPSVLGLTDNIAAEEMNIPLILSLIVGAGFVLASVVVIFNAPRSRSSGAGFKKYAGQIFSFLFLGISTIAIAMFVSNTTQAPTQVDAAILLKEPIEYFEVQLDYKPIENTVTFNRLIPRSGFMPKVQEVEDSPLIMDLKARDGTSLFNTKVVLPQLRVPPALEGEGAVVQPNVLDSRAIIAFVPQFQSQSLLDITFNGQTVISYDVSEYVLAQTSRNNTLRSMAFAPGPAAPNDGYFDLVLLGDDYSEAQLAQFRSDANQIEDTLYSLQPYKTRTSQVRVTLIENTQDLGCYRLPAVPRCVICNNAQVIQRVNQESIPYDKIGVLFNDGEYGGCGDYFGTVFQVANGPLFDMVSVHELGHNLGADDEYTYGGNGSLTNPQTCSATNPNPNWDGIVPRDDYYAECTYDNYYRSSQDSIMRTLNVDYFNAITNRLFNQQLDQLAGNFGGGGELINSNITSPESGAFITQNINVNVEYSDTTNIQRAELWVNGELKATKYKNLNQFFISSIPSSETTIIVKAYDGAERTGLEGRVVLNSVPSVTNTPTPTYTPTVTPTTFTPSNTTPTPTTRVTVTPTRLTGTPTLTPTRTPTVTPTSSSDKPDLKPEGLERSTLNPTYVFKIRICNRGSSDRTIGAMLYEVKNLDNSQVKVYSSILPQANSCLDLENVFCSDMGVNCQDAVRLQVKADPYNYVSEKDENNNTATFTLNSSSGDTPTPQTTVTITPTSSGIAPDLLPEEISYDSTSEQILPKVCNNGGDYTGLLQYYLYNVPDDMVHEADESIVISQGACVDLAPINCGLVSKNCQGDIYLEMVLDPQNEIVEAEELNNRRLLSFNPPSVTVTKSVTFTPKPSTNPSLVSVTPATKTSSSNGIGSILMSMGILMIAGSSIIVLIKYREELKALISSRTSQD